MQRPYRVVVAKPGLDGHDRGVRVIARALRDAGFEVIYTGLFQTPAMIAEAVLQEDADAVGLSVLSGAHLTLFPEVVRELHERELDDVLVFGGGIIPDEDIEALEGAGSPACSLPARPWTRSPSGWPGRSTLGRRPPDRWAIGSATGSGPPTGVDRPGWRSPLPPH